VPIAKNRVSNDPGTLRSEPMTDKPDGKGSAGNGWASILRKTVLCFSGVVPFNRSRLSQSPTVSADRGARRLHGRVSDSSILDPDRSPKIATQQHKAHPLPKRPADASTSRSACSVYWQMQWPQGCRCSSSYESREQRTRHRCRASNSVCHRALSPESGWGSGCALCC